MIPNILFVFAFGLLTIYLTFLTTKGGLTNNKYSKTWDKLTKRGRYTFFVLIGIFSLLLGQELNNQALSKNKEDALNKEIEDRTSVINEGIDHGVESLSKQNLELKKTIDTLDLNSERQQLKIIDLLEQNTNLALQLAESSKKLAYPLPNKLYMVGLSLNIPSNKLKALLPPELNDRLTINFDQNDIDSIGNFKGYVFPLPDIKIKKEFLDLFEGRTLVVNIGIQNDNSQDGEEPVTDLHWNFTTKMSVIKDCNFSYVLDEYGKNGNFQLSLFGSNLTTNIFANSVGRSLKIYNGLSSATELCNKKVRISIKIINEVFRTPFISISHLVFRDNNNKVYEVEVGDFKSYKHYWDDSFMKSKYPNQNFENPIIVPYISGVLKCKSF